MLNALSKTQQTALAQRGTDLKLFGHWKGTLASWDEVATRYQTLIPRSELTEVIAAMQRLLIPVQRKESLHLFAVLKAAFPNGRSLTGDDAALHAEVYLDAFKKFPPDILDTAVKELIAEHVFPPAVAELNQIAGPLLRERKNLLRNAQDMLETHQQNERILGWTDPIKEILADGPRLKSEVVRQLAVVPPGRRIAKEEEKVFDQIEECISRLLKTGQLLEASAEGDRVERMYIALKPTIPMETSDESDK